MNWGFGFLMILFFSSCSSIQITKRKHTKGYHVQVGNDYHNKKSTITTEKAAPKGRGKRTIAKKKNSASKDSIAVITKNETVKDVPQSSLLSNKKKIKANVISSEEQFDFAFLGKNINETNLSESSISEEFDWDNDYSNNDERAFWKVALGFILKVLLFVASVFTLLILLILVLASILESTLVGALLVVALGILLTAVSIVVFLIVGLRTYSRWKIFH